MLKHFLQHLEDTELILPVNKSLKISQLHVDQIKRIFEIENIPVPIGFTEKDVDLSAPPLFNELFALSLVYAMSGIKMVNYSFVLSSVARRDIRQFFTDCIHQATELYNDSTGLMLSKGIYDRPPMINYPKKVEFIKKEAIYVFGFWGEKRPLNSIELTEIFRNIERNYFAVLLSQGLLQVVKDSKIKQYISKGKDISEEQINLFNKLLIKENALGTIPVNMEVTDSTTSPFSDKLITGLFDFLNSVDVMLIGRALSLSMRADLAAHFSKLIQKVISYMVEGYDIMVGRQWLEQPPQQINRKETTK